MEKEAAEAATTGIITLDDGQAYNFGRATTNTITPAVLWSVTATASPIGDLDDILDSLQENGKTEGNAAVYGYSAFKAMLDTDEVKNIADNRRLNFIQAGDAVTLPALPANLQFMVANGFKYVAYVTTYKGRGVHLFQYNEKYQTDAGAWTEHMDPKNVFVFDSDARYDRYFGPRVRFDIETENERIVNRLLGIESMKNQILDEQGMGVIDSRMFNFDTFLNSSKTVIESHVYTSPIYAPTHVDAAGLLGGVIA